MCMGTLEYICVLNCAYIYTHTHIYIYIYTYLCVTFPFLFSPPTQRNLSQLIPSRTKTHYN